MSLTASMNSLAPFLSCLSSICFAIAFVHFCAFFSVIGEEAVIVNTQYGQIEGKSSIVLGKDVWTFIGVPYSEKMIGFERFDKSYPLEQPWNGTYKALYHKPACLQWKDTSFIAGFPNETKFLPDYKGVEQSEDCLYLNIYTPMDKLKNETKAVLVYIHGGLFQRGFINYPMYDGPTLAAAADVVVVFVAYRLGMMGFLDTNTFVKPRPSSVGLSDQELSLKWIQENIHNFNGDKERVTLMGHEAGAVSIVYHLTNNGTESLFRRAILLNSAAMNPIYSAGYASADYKAQEVIETAACGPVFGGLLGPSILNRNIRCLKKAKPNFLMLIQERMLATKVDLGFIPGYISSHTESKDLSLDLNARLERFKQSNRTSNIKEVMLGTNSNEASVILLLISKLFPFHGHQPKQFVPEELLTELMQFGPKKLKPDYPALIRSLFETPRSKYTSDDLAEILQQALFIQSNRILVNALEEKDIRVYEYIFDHQLSNHPWPKWMKGALHMTDIPFIFGRPLIKPEDYTKREIELSRSMIQNIANFVKIGKPLKPEWTSSSQGKFYYNFSTIGEQLESFKTLTEMKYNFTDFYLKARKMLRFYRI